MPAFCPRVESRFVESEKGVCMKLLERSSLSALKFGRLNKLLSERIL
jgi:hypothetical protein